MDIEKVHDLANIFDKKIIVFKEACDFILKSDRKHSKELFLLLLSISDSLTRLSILKMRDCYVISRMIYETTINVLYIGDTDIERRINTINKKYGDTVSRFLQLSYLTIYKTSSDIIHGTLYGARHMLGIVNKKDNTFSIRTWIWSYNNTNVKYISMYLFNSLCFQ